MLPSLLRAKPVADIGALYASAKGFRRKLCAGTGGKTDDPACRYSLAFYWPPAKQQSKIYAPFVYMIHGVDSLKLLQTINRQGVLHNRKIRCLLQVHIAVEETKFGLDKTELISLLNEISGENPLENVQVCGLMGMASFSDDPKRFGRIQGIETAF